MADNLTTLIGKRVEVLDKGYVELQALMGDDLSIVNAARVSFLGESKGADKDKKLLFYLLRNQHTSPFEMVEFKFRLRCPLVTWWQLVRHRTISINLQCLSGDTEITFNRPNRWRKGRHTKQSGNKGQKFTLKRLHDLWNSPVHHEKIADMLLRVYDEQQKVFTVAHLEAVVHSGSKDVFLVTTTQGRQIKCTKDHRFLTPDGWQTLEEATGMTFHHRVAMQKKCFILTNGTTDLWRSYDWMKIQREAGKSVQEIADAAGCSYHNIRKWLNIHNLKFDRTERDFKINHTPWNVGKHYSFHFNEEQKAARSEPRKRVWASKPKSEHHWWRGGITEERNLIGAWTGKVAPDVHKKYNWTCQLCGTQNGKLHAHHVLPVATHPQYAYEFDNLLTVCVECHRILHGKHSKTSNTAKRIGHVLAGIYEQIATIEYVGQEETFDILVKGNNHNFIADGFVVHNSGRYTPFEENDFYVPSEWRKQSSSNKQASEGVLDGPDGEALTQELIDHYNQGYALYTKALEKGVAREMARLFLPGFAVYYTGVVKVDAHNLMRFIRLRSAPDAQYEIRVYSQTIFDHFFKPALPWTAEAFEKYVLQQPDKT